MMNPDAVIAPGVVDAGRDAVQMLLVGHPVDAGMIGRGHHLAIDHPSPRSG